MLAFFGQAQMRNDNAVDAAERALRYYAVTGDSASQTHDVLEWSLALGPRPADEGLQMLDEFAPRRPPGAADLARAALLAMLGRIDEAWPLAEARLAHVREVGGWLGGERYLALIASIAGDRPRACRYHQELIDRLPPGLERVAGSYKLLIARDLCHLGRFDEPERLLRQTDALPASPYERALRPIVEALLLAARGELEEAEALARAALAAAQTETDTVWLQGWCYEDLAGVLERVGRIDDAREALERALALWERKRCLPYVSRVREQIDSLGGAKV